MKWEAACRTDLEDAEPDTLLDISDQEQVLERLDRGDVDADIEEGEAE